jgi:polyvinyl alcohol dehydrogenase (cytochrome)
LLVLVAVVVLASCDWPTYHGNNTRGAVFPGSVSVHSMSTAWQRSLDGAVYASPVLIGSTLVVATENDTLYGINASSGSIDWTWHIASPVSLSQLSALGAPCGNIGPLGITGTPAYDSATNRLFAVAETLDSLGRVVHLLVAVDPATGPPLPRPVPVPVSPPHANSAAHQQRGALTVTAGRVYIPYGGLAGDCGQYQGTLVSRRTDGTGTNSSYTIPTAREAGIWTPPGATVTPNGDLLVAAGNGASLGSAYDGSDAVIELRPDLTLAARFTPSTWPTDNQNDRDLGSSGPALVSSGGTDYVLQIGKSGTAYVLRRAGLGLVRSAPICTSFGGSAVAGSTVYAPCSDGVRAVAVAADGTPRALWKANGGNGQSPPGSPVIFQGSVLATNSNDGRLYALNPSNGVATASLAVGPLTRFATPALDSGHAYVGTTTGVVAVALG